MCVMFQSHSWLSSFVIWYNMDISRRNDLETVLIIFWPSKHQLNLTVKSMKIAYLVKPRWCYLNSPKSQICLKGLYNLYSIWLSSEGSLLQHGQICSKQVVYWCVITFSHCDVELSLVMCKEHEHEVSLFLSFFFVSLLFTCCFTLVHHPSLFDVGNACKALQLQTGSWV